MNFSTTEFEDIFFHHIVLFLDIIKYRNLTEHIKDKNKRKWILSNWQKNSQIGKKIGLYHIVNGVIHNENSYAYKYGSIKRWYICGVQHREDAPAVEHGEYFAYCRNGKLHREDGPACFWYIEHSTYKSWYLHGKLHREDGPAIEFSNGEKCFYLNGHRISEESYKDYIILKF